MYGIDSARKHGTKEKKKQKEEKWQGYNMPNVGEEIQ